MEIYILVRTVTYAQMMLKILEKEGFSCRQIKSPKTLGKNGCGYAVVVKNASPEAVIRLTGVRGLPNFKVYSTEDGRNFERLK